MYRLPKTMYRVAMGIQESKSEGLVPTYYFFEKEEDAHDFVRDMGDETLKVKQTSREFVRIYASMVDRINIFSHKVIR